MSEYQYYEFQAVDRPLADAEMRALRRVSTRATITPTRFVNEYHWGDFKGDPFAWMERYFDAFLYLANWGTRELMLRLPREQLDLSTARRYCLGGAGLSSEDPVTAAGILVPEGACVCPGVQRIGYLLSPRSERFVLPQRGIGEHPSIEW